MLSARTGGVASLGLAPDSAAGPRPAPDSGTGPRPAPHSIAGPRPTPGRVAGLRLAPPPGLLAAARTAVIVPARDEAELVGRCLAALAPQLEDAVLVLVVNNTLDATAEVAEARARALRLPLVLVERRFARGGVGAARRFGFALAARLCPQAETLLTTDADAAVAPGWIAAHRAALAEADAVAGRIETFEEEARLLPPAFHRRRLREERYLGLTLAFEALMDPEGRADGVNLAGGANLGFRAAAYRAAGGFARRESDEDRELIARMRARGFRTRVCETAVVRASLRAQGRAPAGMAAGVAARLAGLDTADSALRPLDEMLARRLPAEPVAPEPGAGIAVPGRTPLADLAALQALVQRLQACATPAERQAVARALFRRRLRRARAPALREAAPA